MIDAQPVQAGLDLPEDVILAEVDAILPGSTGPPTLVAMSICWPRSASHRPITRSLWPPA
jgi:hypothetical protein